MEDSVFERLANALDSLPNGFPRTASNVEILILKKIFSDDEADLASHLTAEYDTVASIAERVGGKTAEIKERLVAMARRGLVRMSRKDAEIAFRLAPFVVGIYESQIEIMDHEFAHLFEEYMANGGAAGIMRPQPALQRVIPARSAVKSEWILPYDDIRKMLENAKSFRVDDCICRTQQDALGSRKCAFPVKNCLTFSPAERPKHANDVTREQAIALLDQSEEIGLVHSVSNVIKGVFYVCNCCGCCCGILRGITDWGIKESVAAANYYAEIDADECTGCGVCVERCQIKAITLDDEVAVVDRGKCIGCGLCVSGCTVEAAVLERKSDAEIVHPPEDFMAWEKLRLRNRSLVDKE